VKPGDKVVIARGKAQIGASEVSFTVTAIATIEKGRVQQSNFNNYRMLRIDETPPIDVHVIKSGEHPGGIGETGATAGPPALRNAIYAATGVPLRRLPIDRAAIALRKA
jgi:isoquinoline 1-oxidoreductase beta subunit